MTDDPQRARERYTILGAIHRGGMGEILLARAEGADGFSRKVVLKGLLPALDDDDASLEMFRREARIMARLEHPNVVRVIDFTYVDDKPYLAMEYVRGRNLHQVIQRAIPAGGLPPVIALHVVAEALRGLHSAHTAHDEDGAALGAIHRDVSPGNVLLSFFGEVKVTDFGIAKAAGARSLTGPRAIRGKARYAAPEVIRGEPATPKSDVFAAGAVLAEALTGEPLWDQRTVSDTLIRIVSEPRDATIERVVAKLPAIRGLRGVLRRSLALYPDDRYASAQAFAEALEQLARTVGGPISRSQLGQYLQQLFAGAPDLPRDDAPMALPPTLSSDDAREVTEAAPTPAAPIALPSEPPPIGPITASLRPPHWSRRAVPVLDTPLRPLRLVETSLASDDAAYFAELAAPAHTEQHSSGSLDGAVDERPLERLSRWRWRLLLERKWVLVTVGILLGAGTAILGTLLATLR